MGKPAARVTDMHVCPMVTGLVPHVGGPVVPPCAPTVLTGSLPQARIGDMLVCVGPPDAIVVGAFTVIVSGSPAARMGDNTAHGGVIVGGMPTVLIGDSGSAQVGSNPFANFVGALALEGAGAAAADMLKGMIEAAREGKPFCEQCMRHALAGMGG